MPINEKSIQCLPVCVIVTENNKIININDIGKKWFGITFKKDRDIYENFTNIIFANNEVGESFKMGDRHYKYYCTTFTINDRTYSNICIIDDTVQVHAINNYKHMIDTFSLANEAIKSTHVDCKSDMFTDETTALCEIYASKGYNEDEKSSFVKYSPDGFILECSREVRGYSKQEIIGLNQSKYHLQNLVIFLNKYNI